MAAVPRLGRPRRARLPAMHPMREFGYAIGQLRRASGLSVEPGWLNEAILRLYPSAADRTDGYAGPVSVPRLLQGRHTMDDIEQGKHDASRKGHAWLSAEPSVVAEQLRGNPVPAWLVRAYDLALGAGGYLIDLYRWARLLDEAHSALPPRWGGAVPFQVSPEEQWDRLVAGFDPAHAESIGVLRAHQMELVRRSGTYHDREAGWTPDDKDSSALYDDGSSAFPEGKVMLPGHTAIVRWGFRNDGSVPWCDRILLYIAEPAMGGFIAPPYLAVPDLEPGQTAVVACPVRAPESAGTYRACFKMAWPDGGFCYPTTLVGVLTTVVVPGSEIAEGWHTWPVAQDQNRRSSAAPSSDHSSEH